MEPVSLSLSVVGVASNIIEASFKIRDQIASYKSATTDIQNILIKVDLVVEICESLKRTGGNSPHHHSDTRDSALALCYSSVLNIHQELATFPTKGQSRRQKMDWLLKRPTIEKSVQGLNESLHLLTSYMLLEISENRTCPKPKTSPVDLGETVSVEVTPSTDLEFPSHARKELRPLTRKTKSIVTKSQSTYYQNVICLYRSSCAQRKDKTRNLQSETRSYVLGIPLLDTYIHIAMQRGPLSPWKLTLSTPRFIYEEKDEDLFKEIILMRISGPRSPSVGEMMWMDKHGLSANTQLVPRASSLLEVNSLLGVMIALGCKHGVDNLLLREGQSLGDQRHILGFSEFWYYLRNELESSDSSDDPAVVYTNMRGPLLELSEYSTLIRFEKDPDYIKALFDSSKEALCDQRDDLLKCTAQAILDLWIENKDFITPAEIDAWLPLISELIRLGLDITQPLDLDLEPKCPRLGTALHQLLRKAFTQPRFVTLSNAREWVKCIEKASVPTNKYLEAELKLQLERLGLELVAEQPNSWDRTSLPVKLEILYYCVNPDEDPLSAVTIRNCMPSFQYMSTLSGPPRRLDAALTHQDWKRQEEGPSGYLVDGICPSWPLRDNPYTRPLWFQERTKLITKIEAEEICTYEYYMYLRDSRAERRQSKKWTKLKKRNGLFQEETMPGSWKMEWWEYQGPW